MFLENFERVSLMIGDYVLRKVDRTEADDFTVSTVAVVDRSWEFETAIAHKDFRDGEWIVVEGYQDRESAAAGHDKWVAIAQDETTESLTDLFECVVFERFDCAE